MSHTQNYVDMLLTEKLRNSTTMLESLLTVMDHEHCKSFGQSCGKFGDMKTPFTKSSALQQKNDLNDMLSR